MDSGQTVGVALVTGAADRLGAAMSRALASAGYATIIHYRTSNEDAETLATEITKTGGRAAIVQADLTQRTDRQGLIAKASEPFGPLNVLVNSASIYLPDSISTLDEELWDQHFAVHTEAPLFLSRDFAAQLPAGQRGNIVNMIDERVWRPSPAYTSYTLSKVALWSATQTMAQELAPRIRVNAIGPGPTLPHAGQSEDAFQQSVDALPLQHGASPEEIGEALLFLLKTPSMTGQMLALDGGEHLKWPDNRNVTPRAEG